MTKTEYYVILTVGAAIARVTKSAKRMVKRMLAKRIKVRFFNECTNECIEGMYIVNNMWQLVKRTTA